MATNRPVWLFNFVDLDRRGSRWKIAISKKESLQANLGCRGDAILNRRRRWNIGESDPAHGETLWLCLARIVSGSPFCRGFLR